MDAAVYLTLSDGRAGLLLGGEAHDHWDAVGVRVVEAVRQQIADVEEQWIELGTAASRSDVDSDPRPRARRRRPHRCIVWPKVADHRAVESCWVRIGVAIDAYAQGHLSLAH